MKVLQHVRGFDDGDGGMQHVVKELVEGLNSRGSISCDVLCQGKTSENLLAPAGYRVFRRATAFIHASAGFSREDFRAWRELRSHYEVIHVHCPWPQSNLNELLAPFKGPIVVHWHSDIVRKKWLYGVFKPFEKWLLNRAAKICVTSEKLLHESAVLGPYHSKCEVIPIGITDLASDVSEVDAAAVRAAAKGRKLIFALGRLVLYKGFGYLIDAAKMLPDDYVIVIGGRGPLRDVLQSSIDQHKLGDRVKLAGFITDGEAQAYMDACTCFCLPSAHNAEAFGIVQVEAMRSGKPVISTGLKGSGVDWVNRHMETGIVVPPGDPHAFAEAIKLMGTDSVLREQLGKNARARYEALFTATKMVAATEQLYKSLR